MKVYTWKENAVDSHGERHTAQGRKKKSPRHDGGSVEGIKSTAPGYSGGGEE